MTWRKLCDGEDSAMEKIVTWRKLCHGEDSAMEKIVTWKKLCHGEFVRLHWNEIMVSLI